ncbi:transmembrane protein 203 [Aplysia californica]|uniref:Transmembrane protein 203 n=1 Tax=Aplysia californica TaxID=6500 RepID=A0ABM1VSD6_APLCA|nr:transmembrane protein 203 [Aplysia californica]XP_035825328.1 transmembrane protein 203 [Aplysia californica]
MLLQLREVISWTRMSAFELFLHLLSILIFSVLVAAKVEGDLSASWPTVFTPLFVCDGLNTYLCLIVFVRLYLEYDLKQASLRVANSLVVIALIFTFKLLLCQKLATGHLNCSEVFGPVFVLSQIFLIRACKLQ